MNHKQRTKMLANHVLSEDHERENIKDDLANYYTGEPITIKELRKLAEDSIWYHAMIVLYGRAEARKRINGVIERNKMKRVDKFAVGFFLPIFLMLGLTLAILIMLAPIFIMLLLGQDNVIYGAVNIIWLLILSGILNIWEFE